MTALSIEVLKEIIEVAPDDFEVGFKKMIYILNTYGDASYGSVLFFYWESQEKQRR